MSSTAAKAEGDGAAIWQPVGEVFAQAGQNSSEFGAEIFAPVTQSDSSLFFVSARGAYTKRFDQDLSLTAGARTKITNDLALGVNFGLDTHHSEFSSHEQHSLNLGLEAFTSIFDAHVNYRVPLSDARTIAFLDPDLVPATLHVEENRLIERHTGFDLKEVPLRGWEGGVGVRLPVTDKIDLRAFGGGFRLTDNHADDNFHGYRGGLEVNFADRSRTQSIRFSVGAEVQDDNRFGTTVRGFGRLTIPLGRSAKRSAPVSRLEQQMGERVRRDFAGPSGTRFTELTNDSLAIDPRTSNAFGGIYFVNGAGTAAAPGTSDNPTTLNTAVPAAGANGVVVVMGGQGDVTTPGVTLADNEYLIGGGTALAVQLTDGTLTQYQFAGTSGTVAGTDAAGAAITLGNGSVVRNLTVTGAGDGILADGVGGFLLDHVTIDSTGGDGLALKDTLGSVTISGLTVKDAGGAGVSISGGDKVTLTNSTIEGGASAVDIDDDGADLTIYLRNLTLSASDGAVLDIDGTGAGTVTVAALSDITIAGGNGESGGFVANSVAFDSDPLLAGLQALDAGHMIVGTTTDRVSGDGVALTDVSGSLTFTDLDIANDGGTGLLTQISKSNDFTLTTLDGDIDTTNGTAIDLDPLGINLTFSNVSSTNAPGAGVVLDSVVGVGTGGNALQIGTLNVTGAGAQGLLITGGSTGNVIIGDGLIKNSAGAAVQIGEEGIAGSGGTVNLQFGADISETGTAPALALYEIGGNLGFTGAISGSGNIVIDGTLVGSFISIAGPTLTGTSDPAIFIDNAAGGIAFTGTTNIVNPLGDGIVIGTVPGGVLFGDVNITGLGAATGLDVTGTHGNVTFGTLDITGTGAMGSVGIDVTGSTNAGNVIIANPSTITGVDIGVNLTNASMSGTFRYGDGNASDGLESTISANIPLVIAGMDGTQGVYNFADVNLVGDISSLTVGDVTAYYVLEGASGTGTISDPGSLAGAEASGASYIVLLNDPAGGQDVLDAASAGGSFDLDDGQHVVSFLNGDTISLTSTVLPSNLIVSGLPAAEITNPFTGSGAPVLTTTSAGMATVNLASNSVIDGVLIQNDGGAVGVSVSGISNGSILNSDISGGNGAVSITDGGVATSVLMDNVNLSSSTGTVLLMDGTGAGTVTVSGSDIDLTATGAASSLKADTITASALTFGSISGGTSSDAAVVLNSVDGSLSVGSVTVAGTGFGPAMLLSNNSGNIDFGTVTVLSSSGAGIQLGNNSGSIDLGTLSLTNTGGPGVIVLSNPGSLNIDGGTISGSGAEGILVSSLDASGSLTVGDLTITNAGTSAIALNNIAGTVTFTGTTAINNPGVVGILLGSGSTGTITFGDVNINGLGANTTGLDARNASGTVSFNTLDITGASTSGTRGIDLTGATFSGSVATVDSGTITGVGIGVDLTNAAITGIFRYGDGSNTDADGAASTISATTPLVIAGMSVATGTYNFADVNLVGDTSNLETSATVYYAIAGGTGDGSRNNPGSLTGAEAASVQYIVLLNNPAGGQDTIDAAVAGGSLDLDAGQTLFSFLDRDTMTLPGGAPNNLILYGITTGISNPYAGSGAPILTTTAFAANTVVLAGNNILDGLVIANLGIGYGIAGSGLTGTTIIRNSTISGANGAINIVDAATSSFLALQNLNLSSLGGNVLYLDGSVGAGSLTVTDFSGITLTHSGETNGILMNEVTFDSDPGTLGAQTVNGGNFTIGTTGARINGTGLSLINVSGSLSFDDLDIANDAGTGLYVANSKVNSFTLATLDGTIDTTNGTAINLDPVTLDMILSSVSATGGTNGVLLSQTEGDFTVTGTTTVSGTSGAGIQINDATNGTITFGSVNINDTGGSGVGLANVSADVNINGGSIGNIDDPAGAGVFVNGGDGDVSIAADITKTTLGAVVAIQNRTGGTATFSGNLTSNTAALGADAGHYGILVSGNTGGTINFTGQTIALNTGVNTGVGINNNTGATINFARVAGGNGLDIVTTSGSGLVVTGGGTTNISGSGNSITTTSGTLINLFNNTADTMTLGASFASLTNTSGANGISVTNTGGGSITGTLNIAGGAITATSSAVEIIGGDLDLTYGGSLTYGSGATAIRVINDTGSLTFNGAINISDGVGLIFENASGTYDFNGALTMSGSSRVNISVSNGDFNFANASIVTTGNTAFSVDGGAANITYAGTLSGSGTQQLLYVNNHTGTLDFSNATLSATAGLGLQFSNADGTYSFGDITLSGANSGIDIFVGSSGTFTFGDVDITAVGVGQTGVDLRGLTGSATFATLDITGASAVGTRGIDLSGNTTSGDIIINESSTITGVDIGVDLTNAAITGTFRYGDGSNVDLDGAASTISATTPLVIAGMNGSVGTYNFLDVNLVGDASNLAGPEVYYAIDGGTGDGSRSNPGSLAGAEASTAVYIVLLNNPAGGQDTIDAATAGGSLDLDSGQTLLSFANTDTFSVAGGAPANLLLYNVSGGSINNPYAGSGAPILTTTATGYHTVTVNNGTNVIDGVIIQNASSTTGAGVIGANIVDLIIRNSTISGQSAAINLGDGAANSRLALENLILSSAGGDVLLVDGGAGAGVLSVTDFLNITILGGNGEVGGAAFNDLVFDADPGTAGLQTVNGGTFTAGTLANRVGGYGLLLNQLSGALDFDATNIAVVRANNVDVFGGNVAVGIYATLNAGSGSNVDFGVGNINVDSISSSGGFNAGVILAVNGGNQMGFSGDLTILATGGASGLTGTSIGGNGTLFFGGNSTITSGGNGLSLSDVVLTNGAGGAAEFGTINVSGGSGNGIYLNNITSPGTTMFNGDVTASNVQNGIVINNAGDVTFAGAVNIINPSGVGVSAVTLNNHALSFVGGLDIATTTGTAFTAGGGGSLTVSGSGNSITTTTGTAISISNSTANALALNLNFDSVNSGTTGTGITISTTGAGGITGSVSIANGAITATTRGVMLFGGTYDFSYGGTIATSGGAARSVEITNRAGGTATFSGNINDTSLGINIANNTGGTINLTGASKILNTGANNAFTMTGNSAGVAVNVTGGGLDIDTTSGKGILVTGGGNLTVSGAGNTVTTTTGTGVDIGAGTGTIDINALVTTGSGLLASIQGRTGGTVTLSGNLITTGTGLGLLVQNNSGGTINFSGASKVLNTGTNNAVRLLSNAGATINFTNGGLDIDTTTGTGFNVTDGGTINVSGANNTINTTSGNVIHITNATANALTLNATFASASNTSGANGILLYNFGTGALTGTLNIGGGAITATAFGVDMFADSLNFTYGGTITTSGAGALSIRAQNRTGGTATFSGNITDTSLGIYVANNTGGALVFSGASKVLNTGGNAAFTMTGNSAGSSVSFTNGGLDIDTTSGTGILVTGGGDLTISGAGNSVTTVTGTGVSIGAGTGAISINADITTTGPALLASIQGRTGGTVTLSGNLNTTNASGTGLGLLVQNNTGGTINFSGASKVLNTGFNNAVRLLSNTGATINFTGGGLDIDTTTGTGFLATGGGTITVQGSNNTINSVSQTALNVANTTIGASGLTFQSISSGNNTAAADPVNGIVLNTTGSLGGLSVTGTGSAGSGGTIQNTTGNGITLTSTKGVNLNYLNITNSGADGINATGVNNFTLSGSNISDTAGDVTADDGITLTNTSGAIVLTNNSITNSRHQGVTIDNFDTNLASLTMTGNTVSGTVGGDGMLMQMRGTSVLTTGVIGGATAALGNTFSNNSATGLQVNNADTGNILSLNVQNNIVNANNAGMDFDLSQGASMNVTVQNNTVTNSHSQAINFAISTSSTSGSLTAVIKNNTIGIAGVVDSGSAIGSGIRLANGGVNVSVTIDSNLIQEVPNGRGIDVEMQAYSANLNENVKITNNTVTRPTGTNQDIGCGFHVPCPGASIFLLADSNGAGGFAHVNTIISGNTVYDPTSWAAGGEGAIYLAVRTSNSNYIHLEGNGALTVAQNLLANNTITNSASAPVVDEGAPAMPTTIVAVGSTGPYP